MEDNYVISVRTNTGRIVLKAEKCHDAKSVAGRLLQSPTVKSVYAGDKLGNAYFYQRKDENGHLITEKGINVPSALAVFG
jgi:hypothetical protein